MNGIVIINKPEGFTSQDVVSKCKKILNEKKAGHAGTLDPLATGVLPVLLGNYTKLSKYLIEHDKTYIACVKLGEKRETGDREGRVIEEKNAPKLTQENVEAILKGFLGKQKQTPPMYSAIKINGKKLYEYARQGETVEVPKRDIEIYQMRLVDFSTDEIKFEVSCSKGTYIRVLCEDIAEKLGTVGYMKNLTRTEVDKFKLNEANTFEDLEQGNFRLITMEEVFNNLPKIDLQANEQDKFLNGVKLKRELKDGLYNVYCNKYIGLGIVSNGLLKRDIVI